MESYIARQPIFSTEKILFGYELLYRDNENNAFPAHLDGDTATRKVISNALLTFDIEALTKGHMAFVNFTRQLLLEAVPMLLNPKNFAIEILEDVDLDLPLLVMLRKYKAAGFTLALDDYTGSYIPYEILSLLDIIKVDFRCTDREQQKKIAYSVKSKNITLLAEKVEDHDDFQIALSLGYTLFQGYYFSKPLVLKKNSLSIATFSYTKLVREIDRPELDFKRIADIIYTDAQFTWLLMKKMRTPEYYRGHTVNSISLALTRMGSNEVRRWVMLLLLQNVIGGEMDELIRTGIIRAVFSECLSTSLSPELQHGAFSAGLFSVIASKEETFYQTLESFDLGKMIRGALTGKNDLSHSLDLILAYEAGDWTLVNFLRNQYFPNVDSYDLSTMYMASVNYADSVITDKPLDVNEPSSRV